MRKTTINYDLSKSKQLPKYPKTPVDQTNVRISDIIRRNLAGEQVMGNTNIAFDYLGTEEFTSMEVNPFNNPGFDLDDVILLADKVGKTITELQDDKGRLDKEVVEAKAKLKDMKSKATEEATKKAVEQIQKQSEQ